MTVFYVFTCDRSFFSLLLILKFLVSAKLHFADDGTRYNDDVEFCHLEIRIMFCGLEIKRLSELLKNKQKQGEM